MAYYYTQGPPRNIDARGLAPVDRADLDVIWVDGEQQNLIHTKIPYKDHNGNEKFIVAAIYEVVHSTLPPLLPPSPPPLNPAYAIRDNSGNGKGIIATRDIAEGEIVIVERPVLICPRVMPFVPIGDFQFQDYVQQTMDPEDLQMIFNLPNLQEDDDIMPELSGIMRTNGSHIILKEGKERYAGLFLIQSLLNHSCGPNLSGFWNPRLFTFSFQAVRPIQAGQELTTSYADLGESHANRRYDLERRYKFQCKCGYCTETSPTSDYDRASRNEYMARYQLETIYVDVINTEHSLCSKNERAEHFIGYLIKELELIRKEGIECMAGMWTYVYLMKACGLRGYEKPFKHWGSKAVSVSDYYTNTGGEEASLEVEEWIGWIKEPTTFPDWAKLQGPF